MCLSGETVLAPSLSQMVRGGVFFLTDHDLLSENFTLGQQLTFFEHRYGQRSVGEAADIACVPHVLNRRPQSLSGDEHRRAELAAALVRRPSSFLADEPFWTFRGAQT